MERRRFLGPHALEDLQPLLELLEARTDAREVVAVGLVLLHEPPRAVAEDQPACGDRVERRRHLGEQRGRAIAVAQHQEADFDPLGDGRKGAHLGPGLEGIVRADAEKMIGHPHGIEADLLGDQRDFFRFRPARSELRNRHPEFDLARTHRTPEYRNQPPFAILSISSAWSSDTGMTESRGRRTSSNPANRLLALIAASGTGLASGRTGSRSTTRSFGSLLLGSA